LAPGPKVDAMSANATLQNWGVVSLEIPVVGIVTNPEAVFKVHVNSLDPENVDCRVTLVQLALDDVSHILYCQIDEKLHLLQDGMQLDMTITQNDTVSASFGASNFSVVLKGTKMNSTFQ
jgi:hypothetical protein